DLHDPTQIHHRKVGLLHLDELIPQFDSLAKKAAAFFIVRALNCSFFRPRAITKLLDKWFCGPHHRTVLCQWQQNLQRPPLSQPGESAVLLFPFRPPPDHFYRGWPPRYSGRVCQKSSHEVRLAALSLECDNDHVILQHHGHSAAAVVAFSFFIPPLVAFTLRILQCGFDPVQPSRPRQRKCILIAVSAG
ncbi:hypothetical protein SAMN05444515_104191, partial [Ectothiorhodospira marina]